MMDQRLVGFILLLFSSICIGASSAAVPGFRSCIEDMSNSTHYCICDKEYICYEKECTFGDYKTIDCNTCFCSETGLFACTKKECEHREYEEYRYSTRYENQKEKRSTEEASCKPGETMKADCNTCSCSDDGQWECTLMACEAFHLLNTTTESQRKSRDGEASCKPGETMKADCNTCSCSDDGQWECTLMACQAFHLLNTTTEPQRKRRDTTTSTNDYIRSNDTHVCFRDEDHWHCEEKECTEGETKQQDCNSCWCSHLGLWACTRIGCGPLQRVAVAYSAVSPGEASCKPGETMKADCNTCFCTEDGQWGCTLMACEAFHHLDTTTESQRKRRDAWTPWTEETHQTHNNDTHFCLHNEDHWNCVEKGHECTEGETKKLDCNSCFCSRLGFWACTLMACPPEKRMAVAYSAVSPDSADVPKCNDFDVSQNSTHFCSCYQNEYICNEKVCTPGEHTKMDCNFCSCGDNGLFACTLMGCGT